MGCKFTWHILNHFGMQLAILVSLSIPAKSAADKLADKTHGRPTELRPSCILVLPSFPQGIWKKLDETLASALPFPAARQALQLASASTS